MYNNSTCSPGNMTFSPCLLSDLRISSSAIVIILLPVAVAGNALILAVIWRNPSLRTHFYITLAALAFTDLITGLVTQPLFVVLQLTCFQESRLSFFLYASAVIDSFGTYFINLTLTLVTAMSIDRWLHMTRRSLLTVRRSCLIVAVVSMLLLAIVLIRLKGFIFVSDCIIYVLLLFCIITTSTAYFKIFKIIRRHQQQVQANESSQNFGQPAIDILKYRKSVFSILYILGVFYLSYLPFVVTGVLYIALGNSLQNELGKAFTITLMFVLLTSSINPLIYIWRMSDIRNGLKNLLKKLLGGQLN